MVKCDWCGLHYKLRETDPISTVIAQEPARLSWRGVLYHFCSISCCAFWIGAKTKMIVATAEGLREFGRAFHS